MSRQRLPNRRPQITEGLCVGMASYDASVGFDPHTIEPKEVFIDGPKVGSDMAFVLADASVLISIALQHGIPASALARSMARIPLTPDDPPTLPASPIGAAIDLLARYEVERGND